MSPKQLCGLLLSVFAVIQAYLWIFDVIDLVLPQGGFYLVIIFGEFVIGLLTAKIITYN